MRDDSWLMRTILALLIASLLLVPAAVAGEDFTIMHEECPSNTPSEEHDACHDEQEAPGVGVMAGLAVLGIAALAARRRL
jgi:MYXO-CTERM domain-containing protein